MKIPSPVPISVIEPSARLKSPYMIKEVVYESAVNLNIPPERLKSPSILIDLGEGA